jgi:hypothetical protein
VGRNLWTRVLVLLVPMMRQAFRFSYAEGAD